MSPKRKIAIIGAGPAGLSCAYFLARLGAKNVTVVYRRTREKMPAYAEEIEEESK
jgi:glycine/D-amino acid oxidase-like deaminating enzyme